MLLGLFLWLCEVALTLTKAKEFVPQPMDSNQESFDRSLTPNVFSGKPKDEMPDFKITKTVFLKGSKLHSWDSELIFRIPRQFYYSVEVRCIFRLTTGKNGVLWMKSRNTLTQL
ncbi:uncharacterized protein ZBIST_5149 [Zygosaccharomyces bailii]|nr:uncharacterized protein ZBIST_5149 [Zygosaccharomyces bailii]